MGDLSRNFSRSEFACPHCGETVVNPKLIDALQALRDLCGVPIRVTSGYRCEKHNREIGGTKSSQHLYGTAADIVIEGLTIRAMVAAAERIPAFKDGGIGAYSDLGVIHVDVRGHQARWGRVPQDSHFVSIREALEEADRTGV